MGTLTSDPNPCPIQQLGDGIILILRQSPTPMRMALFLSHLRWISALNSILFDG